MDTNVFSAGKKWNCSWLSFVGVDANGTNVIYFAGGGQRTSYGTNDPLTTTRLTGGPATAFTLSYRDGRKDVFGFMVTNNAGQFQKAFLTERWDSQNQKTLLYYSPYDPTRAVIRLQYVVDGDGRTNLVYYNATNPYSTNLISSIVDPFGRSCSLAYDNAGRLTNVTDPVGIFSAFRYDANDCVTNLTTPYGISSFSFTDTTGTNVIPNGRSVRITQPDGSHQLYLYADSASDVAGSYATNDTPATMSFPNTFETNNFNFRNTFHWGPRQYAALSTTNISSLTANDFRRARMRHWLKDGYTSVGQTISLERDPSPDVAGAIVGQKTWYDYVGKPNNSLVGSQSLPLLVGRVLPDGTTTFVRTAHNSEGNVLTNISTYSATGTIALRTNAFIYAANDIDLITANNAIGVQVVSNAYNSFHEILTNYNALGEITTFTYNANQQLTSITRPAGLITTNLYDASGFVATTFDYAVLGGGSVYYRTNTYTYTNDLVLTHTDERGLSTTNSYDDLQRPKTTSDPRGTVTLTYDKLDLTRVVDRMGFTNNFAYDSMRRRTAVTNALGNYTISAYCTCGALDSVRDAAGNYTYFFYDNQGKALNAVYPDGFSVTNAYDLLGRVTNTVDGAGLSLTNWFNNQGLVAAVSNAFGQVTSAVYDALDRATNAANASGVTITNAFDNLNRPLVRGYPDGGTERFAYAPSFPALRSYTNQLGSNVVNYGYDPLGRKTNEISVGIATNLFAYSPAGDLVMLTDGKNQTTTWNYDQFGRATNKIDAASNVLFVYKYDPDNRLTNRWTPAKGATVYAYDALGSLTNIQYPVSSNINLAYDMLNRLTNVVDASGVTTYTWDAASELLSEDGPWTSDVLNYSYTNRLRKGLSLLEPNASPWLQTYAYDAATRLTNITSPAGAFGYQYVASRPSSLVSRLSLPNGSAITNAYDSNTRLLATVLINSGSSILNSHQYTYNAANQRTEQTFTAGNYTDYTYDNRGQLLTAKGRELGGTTNRVQEQLGYAYDAAGNLNWRTNNALVQLFNVNSLNELTTNTRSGTLTVAGSTTGPATSATVNTLSTTLYLDNTFARSNFTLANGNNTFTAVAYDSYGRQDQQQITVNLPATNTFAYDLNGNLRTNGTQILDYDDENHLVTNWVAGAWKSEFVYDSQHRRRIQRDYSWSGASWTPTNETRFIYDGKVIIQERDASNLPKITLTRGLDLSSSLQGAGGIGGLLAMTENSAIIPVHNYYHSDGSGNVSCLINTNQLISARYLYDPFGNTLSISGPKAWLNQYRFSSKPIREVSGMYDFLRRWFLPDLQRWPNRDPVDEMGGLNLYGYVANSPLNLLDPLGFTSLTINGTVYPIHSQGDFKSAIATATEAGRKIESLVFEGHGVPGIGALVVNDQDHVALESQFQAPELYNYIKTVASAFKSDCKVELKACGSANPGTYCAADAFKKALPDAEVFGYTGLLFQIGSIEFAIPNNKFTANNIWGILLTPGKGALENVPLNSQYVKVK
jgi:RHS repeat-associated protein